MALTDILIDIQQRERGLPLTSDVVAELRELAVEFGVEDGPWWLLSMFRAVQQGCKVLPPVFFEFESSDPYGYLAEVASLLRWQYQSEGEYQIIEFPGIGWRIYISNEMHSPITGNAGSEYRVTPLCPNNSDQAD